MSEARSQAMLSSSLYLFLKVSMVTLAAHRAAYDGAPGVAPALGPKPRGGMVPAQCSLAAGSVGSWGGRGEGKRA